MEDGSDLHGYNTEVVSTKGSLNLNFYPNHEEGAVTDDSVSSSYSSDGESSLESPSKTFDDDDSLRCDSPSVGFTCHVDAELSRETGAMVYDAADLGSVTALIASRVECCVEDAAFMVCNLGPVIKQFQQWKHELPMVEPFYAVKCNPDPAIIRLLASLGCGFDCATMGEIELVLNGLGEELSFGVRGLASKSIVYANPAKMASHIKYAMDNEVRMTVFDSEDELYKIASLGGQKKFDLLLRLTTDDKSSVCKFSKKFGCPVEEAPKLLELAKSLNLHVAGVSFHVGSGCGDSSAYITALSHTRLVFEAARGLGMPAMNIVDIGGGFPGDKGGYGGPGMPTFSDLAAAVRAGIDSFSRAMGKAAGDVRFIAEPGRYFVSASHVLATKVYSRKGGQENYQALYVDDGVYGSFNNILYDHYTPVPIKLCLKGDGSSSSGPMDEDDIPTSIFGPTCDGLDQMCSVEDTLLSRCAVGDWIIWENMGAYTHTASFVFNGYTHIPSKVHCIV